MEKFKFNHLTDHLIVLGQHKTTAKDYLLKLISRYGESKTERMILRGY